MSCSLRVLMFLGVSFWIGCDAPVDTPANSQAVDSLPPGAVVVGAPPATPEPTTGSNVVESEVAGVGVGDRGQGYGNDPITLPAATYWKAQEKIAFEVSIPHALQLYKALNPDGKGPVSHEAFMQDVIAANRIELPRLPEGKQYRYDPQTETLFVDSIVQSP